VLALVRATDRDELARKSAFLAQELKPYAARVTCRPLNLPDAAELSGFGTDDVRYIVHGAAVTEFNVPRPRAESVNVAGTAAVLRFARSCRRLERVVLVSSVYSSGLRAGEIAETKYDDSAGFANHYEWSKWSAESLLTGEFVDLPWQVHRLATVLCDELDGSVVQFNVLHKMWRLLYLGLLPLVPGSADTPLYFLTGQYGARATDTLMRKASSRTFFHLCNSGARAVRAGELLGLAFDAFARDEQFARRRVLRPLFADQASFDRLADSAEMFSKDALGAVIGLMRPFAPQLFINKSFRTDLTTQVVDHFGPDWATLVPRTCGHLLASSWGLRPGVAPP
jgi:thioester reductase-like protein